MSFARCCGGGASSWRWPSGRPIAALVALALAQLLHMPLPLWAVITAMIVTQMSVGRSLKASFDYLIGTLGGAIYGGAVAVAYSP